MVAMQSYHQPHLQIGLPVRKGSLLRIAADLTAMSAAFLLGWFVVGDRGFSELIAPEHRFFLGLMASLLILMFIGLAGAGFYSRRRRYTLSTKLSLIAVINLFLLVAAIASLAAQDLLTAANISLLVTTFAGSAFFLGLARIGSVILRAEEGNRGTRKEPDERKVLVIGGAGYIGSALVEQLLARKLQVTVFDALHFGEGALARVSNHPQLVLIREDFRHIEVLARAMEGVGSVIHLGGLVGDPACALDSDLTIDVNVTATKVIGEIAKAAGVRRFIFASSCSVYGACDDVVDESARFNPQSLYARTKVASEAILAPLNSPDFAVTCLRFATIYGISGRTRFDLVVNLLCAKAVRDGVITVYGADQWRPFVHVEDVARAIVMTLTAPVGLVGGQVMNVGSDSQNYTLGQIAALIKQQVPDATIVSDDTFSDRRNYRVSFQKIRALLGFEPAWTIECGISQVVAIVRSNEVGHYAQPTYSNFLYLKECGTGRFGDWKITGWENELMNLDRVATLSSSNRTIAA
jgi:nucleoside-diphosphate-sugar epimerase